MYEEMCCVCVVSECPNVFVRCGRYHCKISDNVWIHGAVVFAVWLHFAWGAVEDLVVYGMLIASCAGSLH